MKLFKAKLQIQSDKKSPLLTMLPTKDLYICFPKLLMEKGNLENLCEDEVYQAMNGVDNTLLPDDQSLDIVLFNLLKEEEDNLVNDENITYKDVIELLMQQDKANSIDKKDCEN